MKFNVGDKVRVKSLDWYNSNKDDCGYICCDSSSEPFVNDMEEYCGKTLEIISVVGDCYYMVDGDGWMFDDFMLEDGVVNE